MPSASNSKPIHLAKNLETLNNMAEIKQKIHSSKVGINAAVKVFKKAETEALLGDEETAYVMYMKFFNLISLTKKATDFKKQEKFFNDMIGRKNQVTAIEEAERLSASLKERYDLQEAVEVKAKLDKIDKKQEEMESKKKQEEEEKEKQKKDEEEKRMEEEKKAVEVKSDPGSISCEQLYQLLQDTDTSLLIMDIRSLDDYKESHLKYNACISVPSDILTGGCTVKVIEKSLPPESVAQWGRRGQVDIIVLLDWRGSVKTLQVGTPMKSLKDAIFKWDQSVIIKSDPVVLEGGYENWLMHYPTLTTNARVNVQSGATKTSPDLPSLDFDYPDFEADVLGIKKPEPEPEKTEDKNALETPAGTPTENNRTDALSDFTSGDGSVEKINGSVPRVDRSLKPKPLGDQSSTLSNDPSSEDSASSSSSDFQHLYRDLASQLNRPVSTPKRNDTNNNTDLNNTTFKIEKASSQSDLRNRVKAPTIKVPDRSLKPGSKAIPKVQPTEPATGPRVAPVGGNQTNKDEESIKSHLSQLNEQSAAMEEELKKYQMERERLIAEHKARQARVDSEKKKYQEAKAKREQEEEEIASLLAQKKELQESAREQLMEKQQRLKQKQEEEDKEQQLKQQQEEQQRQIDLQKEKEREEQLRQAEIKKKQLQEEAARLRQLRKEQEAKKREEEEARRIEEARLEAERLEESRRQEEAKRLQEEAARQQEAKRQEEIRQLELKRQEEAKQEEARKQELRKQEELRIQQRKAEEERAKKEKEAAAIAAAAAASRAQSSSMRPQPDGSAFPPGSSYTTMLKDEPVAPKSNLRRSNSSPNIAKLMDDKGSSNWSRPQPSANREAKPSPPPEMQPTVTEVTADALRAMQPVYGCMSPGLTGLRNLGNTCYMNSTLQCLSNTPPLALYFLNGNYKADINRQNFLGHKGRVADEYALLITVLWSGQYKYVSPRNFKGTVGRLNNTFAGFNQQDSQEFLMFLQDGLHEDLNKVRQRPKLGEQQNDNIPENVAADRAWKAHKLLNESIMVELFQGQYKSTMQCLTCQKRSITFDTFMFLSVPIPSQSRCSLQDCIQLFLQQEKMTRDCKWNCPQCKRARDSVKKIDIWKLPPVVLFHLKRFYREGHWNQKLNTYVDYPLTGLDLNRYIAGPSKRKEYNLYAVSNHYGTMEAGHYTAFCKSPVKQTWFKYDDSDVYDISKANVKSSAAYILFYTSMEFRLALRK